MTFSIQWECFISVLHSYVTIKFVYVSRSWSYIQNLSVNLLYAHFKALLLTFCNQSECFKASVASFYAENIFKGLGPVSVALKSKFVTKIGANNFLRTIDFLNGKRASEGRYQSSPINKCNFRLQWVFNKGDLHQLTNHQLTDWQCVQYVVLMNVMN